MLLSQEIYDSKIKKIKKVTFANFIELALVGYFLVIILVANANGDFYKVELDELMLYFGSTIPLALILIVFTRFVLGSNDYRFKITIHFIVAGYSASLMGLFWQGTGIMDPDSYDSMELFLTAFTNFLASVGVLMIFFIAAVMGALSVVNPFMQKMDLLSKFVGEGDYSVRIENDKEILNDSVFGPIAVMSNSVIDTSNMVLYTLRETIDLIGNTSTTLSANAEELSASANEVSSTSQNLAEGSSQQAEMIEQAVRQFEEVSLLINDIITQIQDNTQLSTEIADETKYLALNARIEAARAGASGRGFAVVADDVRNLSDQSREASVKISEISHQIKTTLHALFDNFRDAMSDIAAVSEESAASAQELAASSQEMTTNVKDLANEAQIMTDQVMESENLIGKYKLRKSN